MSTATTPHDSLLPQPHGGMGAGVGISLLAHAALLAALAGVVQWRTQAPQAVAAELWAAVPERAAQGQPQPTPAPSPTPLATVAPPPPAPPPAATPAVPVPTTARVAPPPEPARPAADIATERASERDAARAAAEAERQRQQAAEREKTERAEKLAKAKRAEEAAKAERAERAEKAERQRKEQQAQARAAQEAKEAREAEARTESARQDNLRRMMSQAGQATGTAGQTGSRDAAPSAGYKQRIAALIHGNTVFNGEVSGNPAAEVEVRAAASGSILSRRLIKSSGNAAWDEAVLKAIDRTATLPRDTDGRVPPTLIIEFRSKAGAG